MKRKIMISGLTLLLAGIFSISYSQDPVFTLLRCSLTDIDGEAVANTNVHVDLKVVDSQGEEALSDGFDLLTDGYGSYIMSIPKLTLFKDGTDSDPAVIEMTLSSPDEAEWLEEDEFTVKYLLQVLDGSDAYSYALTRMEGQKLTMQSGSGIFKFSDVYPFAYVKSMFLISSNTEANNSKALLQLAEELFPDEEIKKAEEALEEAAPASRGVKGSFAVGGYKKN